MPSTPPPPGARTRLLLLSGRSGVGKSSVAFALHDLLVESRVRHAVVEGDLLDLTWPTAWEHRLAERNLAAVWANYRGLGYDRLVYTNTVSVLHAAELAAAMGDDPLVTRVLLTADDATARARLAGREHGAAFDAHVRRSDQAARTLDEACGPEVHRVATDGRSVVDLARELYELWVAAQA